MREKFTISTEPVLFNKLRKLSEITRIPISRLIDESLEYLLDAHNYNSLLKEYEKKQKLKNKIKQKSKNKTKK